MNDLKSRIEALETKIGQMNTEIAALQKIVDDAVTVVKVEKSADGYVIYFSDNTTAEIKNGTAGADAPVIGVKQDTDEVYYWTITTDGKTEWLMAGGAKLRVTGESVKPVMSVVTRATGRSATTAARPPSGCSMPRAIPFPP